jgi:hypothetical protein
LIVRRAFGRATQHQTYWQKAEPQFLGLGLLPFCPSCEKISVVRGGLDPLQQLLRFELHFGSPLLEHL